MSLLLCQLDSDSASLSITYCSFNNCFRLQLTVLHKHLMDFLSVAMH